MRLGHHRAWIPALTLAFMLSGIPLRGQADSFQKVSYDPATDELVITVIYRGTNPDHQFSLKWGACQGHDDDQREIVGELLDQQALDAARKEFRKTLRFSIADLDCRPAMLTVRTAPRFYFTLQVPAPAMAATTH
jgi:hypothetical protein